MVRIVGAALRGRPNIATLSEHSGKRFLDIRLYV